MPRSELRELLAEMICAAADGELEPAEVLATEVSLSDLGLTSLFYLRLVDAVERTFGVVIDPGAAMTSLDTLESLVDLLAEHGPDVGTSDARMSAAANDHRA